MKIYNPTTLDLSCCGPTVEAYPDDARYFLHLLFQRRIFDKRHPDAFVEINMAHLRKQITFHAAIPLVRELLASGVVETDGHWIEGRKSKGYRLREDLRHAPHRRIDLTSKRLVKKVAAWRTTKKEQRPLLPVHQALLANLQHLEIDFAAAVAWAHRAFLHALREQHGRRGKNATRKRKKALAAYNQRIHSIEALANKDFFLIHDDYGRVHSNVTSLSSPLRRHLSLSGNKLVEIDIVNSQPLIFGMLLIQWYQNEKNGVGRSPEHVNNLPPTNTPHPRSLYDVQLSLARMNNTTLVAGYNLVAGLAMDEDVINYVRLCEIGTLYEHLMAINGETDRTKVKKDFFRLMFGRNRHERANCFQDQFPNAYLFSVETKAKDYRALSHLLQQVESKVIIYGVAARLCAMNVSCVTIHDSFLVAQDDVPVTLRLIEEEFRQWHMCPSVAVT